ncbi:TPA_asm: hypothetical protein HUJ06_032057 [Nelumbo nucifera]|uniref:Early light-induced protein, chloroplastic-like n=2 Tax=Nelumbo nucifera TaxID=4432 RepID=A0A1U8QCJ5_NELNU|nr:PREDICTED: early light-induced protein, chloroplastic-like [Nelumbo nucifera]DAD49470.1 TPA_asm: hypothetical protein HUJ06_032057 [Nelumbo nucifera]
MASSVSMQSILVNPVAVGRLGHRGRPSSMVFPSTYFPRQQKNGCTLQVRCMAEESQKEQKSSPVSAPPSPPQHTTPSGSPKVSTKFTDVLAFSGPAPKRK